MKLKSLEYSGFASVTIVIAQLIAGFIGAISVVFGCIGLFNEFFPGLMAIGHGIVFLGIFFGLARVLDLKDPDESR